MSARRSHKQKKNKEAPTPKPHGVTLHKLHLINVCLLIVVGIILYFSTLNAPFLFDDTHNILESSWIKTPANFLNHYFKDGSFYKHRIIPYSTFALNWHFSKDHSFGYHLVNVAIHILNSFLIYLITLKLLSIKVNNLNKGSPSFLNVSIKNERDRIILSLAVALLFISHPIQTNVVIYIVQRMVSIVTFFYLLSFYLFIKAVHLPKGGPKKAILYTGSFFTFIMAFYSKEVAITLPLIMMVYYWIFGVESRKIALRRGFLIFLSTGSVMGLVLYILFSSGYHYSFPHWSGPHLGFLWGIKENLYTQANVIIEYAKLLILPLPSKLSVDHAFPLYKSLFQFPTYLSLSIVLALNLFALLKARKFPHLCFCILWWFVALIPSSSIWPIWDIMVEYRTYLPGFGFYLFLVLGIHQVCSYLAYNRYWIASKHVIVAECIILALLVLSYIWGTYERSSVWRNPIFVGTYERSSVWRNPIFVWMDASKKSPYKARPHINLGEAYAEKGRLNDAISEYKQALVIKPRFAEAHNNLGDAYTKKGRLDEAIRYAKAHYNLGVAYFKWGKLDEAIAEYRQALTIKPRYAEAHNNLGITYVKKGKLDRAISKYKKALSIKPRYADAHYNLGVAYAKKGRLDEAITAYKQALALNPQNAEAHVNLGVAYQGKEELADAISEYKKALVFNPNYAGVHNNLAMAYFKDKKYTLAIRHCDKAIELGFKVDPKLLKSLIPYRKDSKLKTHTPLSFLLKRGVWWYKDMYSV